MKRTFLGILACVLACGLSAVPAEAQDEWGYLRVESNPGRAGIFIDGDYIGPGRNHGSTRRYQLEPGTYDVTLSDSQYEDDDFEVTIVAGETTSVSRDMTRRVLAEPPFGILRTVHEDKWAAVYVNGAYMGFVDEFNNPLQGLLLNPGEYLVEIGYLDTGIDMSQTITIVEGETSIVWDRYPDTEIRD